MESAKCKIANSNIFVQNLEEISQKSTAGRKEWIELTNPLPRVNQPSSNKENQLMTLFRISFVQFSMLLSIMQ